LRRNQRSASPLVGTSAGRWKQLHRSIRGERLVWYEEFDWMIDAIKREKAIKTWPRAWKIELIEKTNPGWHDLSSHLVMF
jgi:predicted GIY-YIG superfamily endonuclease